MTVIFCSKKPSMEGTARVQPRSANTVQTALSHRKNALSQAVQDKYHLSCDRLGHSRMTVSFRANGQVRVKETVAYLRQKAHDGTAKAASSHTAKGGGLLLELGKTTPYPLAFTMPCRRRSTPGYCSMTIINNDSIAAPIRCVELCQVDETFAATANTPSSFLRSELLGV